jgi:hypothetical protein
VPKDKKSLDAHPVASDGVGFIGASGAKLTFPVKRE